MTTGLVLASNSPRRRELFTLGGWAFRVQAVEVNEQTLPDEAAAEYVLRLAQSKAQAAAGTLEAETVVVAADTTVADGEHILGKPRHASEAIAMLRRLRGRTHRVYTALAVLRPKDGLLLTDLCATDVPMRAYSEEEIAAYVASGDPLDKAGAYAIQSRTFHPALALSGCYANVMGLPLCHLGRLLRRAGLANDSHPADLPAACQAALDYTCDVYPQIWGSQ